MPCGTRQYMSLHSGQLLLRQYLHGNSWLYPNRVTDVTSCAVHGTTTCSAVHTHHHTHKTEIPIWGRSVVDFKMPPIKNYRECHHTKNVHILFAEITDQMSISRRASLVFSCVDHTVHRVPLSVASIRTPTRSANHTLSCTAGRCGHDRKSADRTEFDEIKCRQPP